MRLFFGVALFVFFSCAGEAQIVANASATPHAGAANRLMQDRRYAEAAAEFQEAVALDPANDTLRVQYATCLFAEESNQEAKRQFEILRQRLGDRPGLIYFLGQIELRTNDFKGAVEILHPLATNAAFPKVSYYLGLAYLGLGDDAEGLHFLERAAAQNPQDSEVHYRLARLYSKAGREHDAEGEYARYNELLDEQRIAEQKGHDCMDALRSKALDSARNVCQPLAQSTNPRELTFVGRLYLQASAFADALPPLQQAVKLDPKSFDASYYLGATLYGLRRYPDAVQPLETAVSLNPLYFDSINLLAKTYHLLGNDSATLRLLERAHSLNPDDAVVTEVLERMRAASSAKH